MCYKSNLNDSVSKYMHISYTTYVQQKLTI
jgi:hypothetical protein